MKALAPHMGATRFTRWIVKSSELPLRWDDALKRSDPAESRWNSPFASETPGSPAGVEIGEYQGVVRVLRRVFQRLLPETPTPERCLEAY